MGFWDFFSRGSRVARGKANAAMDSLEDATFETTVQQTIKDMKQELRKLVNASADAVANAARLERQHGKIVANVTEWRNRAKTALKSSNEDLARKALAKSKEFEQEASKLQPSVDGARKTADTLKARIDQMNGRISEAERNASTLVARKNAAVAQKKVAQALADVGNADDAFATLGRFEQAVEKEEAAAIAFDELAAGGSADAALEDEFAALEVGALSLEMEDDLAALKTELES